MVQLNSKVKAFTMIEVIVVILVLSAIFGTAALLISSGFRNYFASRDIGVISVPAGLALERMERDIRQAVSMTTTTSSTLNFQTTSGVSITYTLSGSSLTRQEGASAAKVLASSVTGLTFSYLDSALNVTVVPANVFYVNIALTVTRSGSTLTYNATAQPRNIL